MFNQLEDILTYRGLSLLRRFGNGSPSFSQIEFAQNIISIIDETDEGRKKLSILLENDTQSRESLQKDSIFIKSNID